MLKAIAIVATAIIIAKIAMVVFVSNSIHRLIACL
jgi:hypothetical protein